MAGAGFWRDTLIVQEPSTAIDALGQATPSWSSICTVRGQIRPTKREVMDDLGNAVRTDLEIECAYHPDITARCRIFSVQMDRTYYISSVTDASGYRRRALRIVATEQAP